MRGVFFGTSEFAVPSLRAFAAQTTCVLVVTQPDRPAGRGNKVQATPVKRAAIELGIPTVEPLKMRDAFETLRAANGDVFGVASYGKIVPQAILDLAPLGALNVHPSLLPLYRGATPLQSQIRDGVVESGVTIILMDAGMDTGDIVLQEHREIGADETYGELHDRFADLGASMLSQACEALRSAALTRTPQARLGLDARAEQTTTRPLRKNDWVIGSYARHTTARDFANFVRSLAPAPAARVAETFTFSDLVQKNTKILRAHPLATPGPRIDVPVGAAVVASGTVLVRASDGWLHVDQLAIPGGKPMLAGAFRHGYPITGPEPYREALAAWAVAHPPAGLRL